MNQESLTEPPGETDEKELGEIITAIKKDRFKRLCLSLNGGEPEIKKPNKIIWPAGQENPRIMKVEIKKTGNGERDVRLETEEGVIVGFRLRSP